jgi:hypothetical protein
MLSSQPPGDFFFDMEEVFTGILDAVPAAPVRRCAPG